jgi:hypothetical protein
VERNPYAPPNAPSAPLPQVGVSRGMLLLVAGVFIAYGVYALLQALNTSSVPAVLIGLVSAVGGVGLALGRRWSRFCIYVVSILLVGDWLQYAAASLQYQGYPSQSTRVIGLLIALFPGLCIVVIAAGGSYLVNRHFRRK